MNGYIQLHRSLMHHFLWSEKPFSRGQAWIDLLLLANYKFGELMSKGEVVEIERGQVFRSIKSLAERWGWSEKKVRNFLELLEKQEMISKKGLKQGTIITIEKYAMYQGEGQDTDEQRTSRGRTGEVLRANEDIQNNKNKKNNKKKNDYIRDSGKAETFAETLDYQEQMRQLMRERGMT